LIHFEACGFCIESDNMINKNKSFVLGNRQS